MYAYLYVCVYFVYMCVFTLYVYMYGFMYAYTMHILLELFVVVLSAAG